MLGGSCEMCETAREELALSCFPPFNFPGRQPPTFVISHMDYNAEATITLSASTDTMWVLLRWAKGRESEVGSEEVGGPRGSPELYGSHCRYYLPIHLS